MGTLLGELYKNLSLHNYYLYGFSLRSQWPLPCPQQKYNNLPEVKLLEGSASSFSDVYLETQKQVNPSPFFHYAHLPDGSIYIRWSGLFEFLISHDGRLIVGHPLNNANKEAFLNYLLGQTLSFAIVKQGIEPLHSTVVRVNDFAVGFIGDCGYGKSSLAAGFLQAGYPLLTDDLLVLRENNGCFLAYPGLPRIKLFPKIAKSLIGERVKGFPIDKSTSKLIFPLGRYQSVKTTSPLKVIYVLSPPKNGFRSQGVTIRKLSHRSAFLSLLKNTYNPLVTEPDRLKRQFALAHRVVSKIPFKLLSYTRTLKSLPLIREAILEDLKKL
jgi:hypothetical protein